MWKIAYNVALSLILPFFAVFALTNRKIRKNFGERFFPETGGSRAKENAIWVHAASVGEAAIAEALINFMKTNTGIDSFIVTTHTYYTRDLLTKKFNDMVFSLPFDTKYSVQRFMRGSTFRALIIVETELWPNLIWEAKRRGIPVVIVNGRISDSTLKNYRRLSFFVRRFLSDIDLVLAQSEEHAGRFISIGMDPQRVINSGNIKYFRELPRKNEYPSKENVVTFGSIKEKELGMLLPVIANLKKNFPEVLVFVVPRDLFLVSAIEEGLSEFTTSIRYSLCKATAKSSAGAVVVDTVGDLLDIYGMSKVAFVGGSLAPYGGQNILEPLFFGTPVVFGPHTENFREIAETIVKEDAGIQVNDGKDLYEQLKLLLENETLRNQMGARGMRIIEMQRTVMKKTVEAIMKVIEKERR